MARNIGFAAKHLGDILDVVRTHQPRFLEALHGYLATATDLRTKDASLDEYRLSVELMDGRPISVPLAWYRRLANATPEQRRHWKIAGGGYGIHWPDIDEDLSTQGMLRGAPAASAVSG